MLLGMVAFSNGTGSCYAHIDFVFHSVCVDKMEIVGLMTLPGILEREKDVWGFFFLNFFEWGFLPFWSPSAPERAIRWVSRISVWEIRMGRYRKGDIINRDAFWVRGLCQVSVGWEFWGDLWGRRGTWVGLSDLATVSVLVSVLGSTRGHSFFFPLFLVVGCFMFMVGCAIFMLRSSGMQISSAILSHPKASPRAPDLSL